MRFPDSDVKRAGEWIDGEDMDLEKFGRIVSANVKGTCVVCNAKQPSDVLWPSYAMELQSKLTGESEDVQFNACPPHEATVDGWFAWL